MLVRIKWFPAFKEELPKNLDGKVFVITGTTSGTGYVAGRTVGELGGEAVLLNRKSTRVDTMLQKLQEEVPNGKFVCVECDLQDFASVRTAAQEIKRKYNQIYCLANNAGIMATPDKATVDGYDTQMQTNHLSHFLLTAELLPLLEAQAEASGDARIVNHSSEARNMTPKNSGLDRKYLEKNGGNLGGDKMGGFSGPCFERYFQSKLANSVFTYGLHEKLQAKNKDSKIRVVCCHPGGSDTNLADHLDGFVFKFVFAILTPLMMQTQEDGAMGLIRGMMHPDAESGVLYGPAGMTKMKGPAVVNPPNAWENDPKAIEMLWETSEAATGAKLP